MMTDPAPIERRVTALEVAQNDTTETLRWVVAKVGRIAAVQDEHTLRFDQLEARFDKLEGRFDKLEGRVGKVEGELAALRRDMPAIVAEALREVLKNNKE